jgi:hypothetical protein
MYNLKSVNQRHLFRTRAMETKKKELFRIFSGRRGFCPWSTAQWNWGLRQVSNGVVVSILWHDLAAHFLVLIPEFSVSSVNYLIAVFPIKPLLPLKLYQGYLLLFAARSPERSPVLLRS